MKSPDYWCVLYEWKESADIIVKAKTAQEAKAKVQEILPYAEIQNIYQVKEH